MAKSSGLPESVVESAYQHVFIEEHELDGGRKRFYPDYDMAQSRQRLREGKVVYENDRVFLLHEAKERELMAQGLGYDEAHKLTVEKYGFDYQGLLSKWGEEGEPGSA